MAIVTTDNKHYSDIADAIRNKGVNGLFTPSQMAAAIGSITAAAKPEGSIIITANGTYDVSTIRDAIVSIAGDSGISRTYLGSFSKDSSNSNQSAIAAVDWPDGLAFNSLMFCPSDNPTAGKLIPYLSDSTIALTNNGIFFQNGNVGGKNFNGTIIATYTFAIEARASADTRTVVIDFSRWAGGFGSLFWDKTINVYACTIDFGGAEA